MSVLKTYQNPKGHPSSVTWVLDPEQRRLCRKQDGKDAMQQAIWLALSVERFAHEIYSRDYGAQLEELLGKPRSYLEGDIRRRIEETLLQDDRIEEVGEINLEFDREGVELRFLVKTIYGELEGKRRLEYGGSLWI